MLMLLLPKSAATFYKIQTYQFNGSTVFENHRKRSHSTLRAKRATFTLHTKVNQNCQKWSILASFWKPEACSQTVLPDRSLLIRQKLVENAKIKKKFKCHILRNYQTMRLF